MNHFHQDYVHLKHSREIWKLISELLPIFFQRPFSTHLWEFRSGIVEILSNRFPKNIAFLSSTGLGVLWDVKPSFAELIDLIIVEVWPPALPLGFGLGGDGRAGRGAGLLDGGGSIDRGCGRLRSRDRVTHIWQKQNLTGPGIPPSNSEDLPGGCRGPQKI